MTSAKHPTSQQSVCATSKTDLMYWDTPHRQHGQPGQHEPSTRYPRPNEPDSLTDEKQHHWFENFGVSCPETRQAVPMHETLRQAVKFAKYSQHTLADAPATNTCVRSETQWRQENAQEHREHCTTKPQTFSRVSLPRWKGVWAHAVNKTSFTWYSPCLKDVLWLIRFCAYNLRCMYIYIYTYIFIYISSFDVKKNTKLKWPNLP